LGCEFDSTGKNSRALCKLLLTCFLAFHTLPPSINETHCESLIEKQTFIPLGYFCWFHRQQQMGPVSREAQLLVLQ
jgi:hypothetical protein